MPPMNRRTANETDSMTTATAEAAALLPFCPWLKT